MEFRSIISGFLLAFVISIISSNLVTAINLKSACAKKFKNIDNVADLLQVAGELRQSAWASDDGQQASKAMHRCIKEYDSIMELTRILQYDRDVCHPNHIEQLLAFSRQFMNVSPMESFKHPLTKNKKMIRHLFRRYVLQVALTCQRNAVANLREISDEFDSSDWIQVMPWRNATRVVTKQSRGGDDGDLMENQLEDNDPDGKKLRQDLVDFVESIENIDQLTSILPIGINAITSRPQTSMSPAENELYEEAGINMKDDEHVIKTIGICDRFAKYYETQILSVVRLANAGYKWDTSKLKERYDEADLRLLGDWYKLTQICHPLRKLKNSLGCVSGSDIYQDFANNRLAHNQEMISRDFIAKNSISSVRFFAREVTRRQSRFIKYILDSLIKKIHGKNAKRSSMLVKLRTYMDLQAGDRPSKMDEYEVKFWLWVTAVILFLGGLGVLIWWCVTHPHHGSTYVIIYRKG